MRFHLALLLLTLATGCRQDQSTTATTTNPEVRAEYQDARDFPAIVAPLIDPAKLDGLEGKRAATPRLRKACYWLEMATRAG